jgi:hypothetical protein
MVPSRMVLSTMKGVLGAAGLVSRVGEGFKVLECSVEGARLELRCCDSSSLEGDRGRFLLVPSLDINRSGDHKWAAVARGRKVRVLAGQQQTHAPSTKSTKSRSDLLLFPANIIYLFSM